MKVFNLISLALSVSFISHDSQALPFKEEAKLCCQEKLDAASSIIPISSSSDSKLVRRATRWTAEEETRLIRLREEDNLSWVEIYNHFPDRSNWQAVARKYYSLTRSTREGKTSRRWTEQEDKLLRERVEEGKSWEEIAEELPGRSPRAVKAHHSYLPSRATDAPKTVKKRFTREEDELLLELGPRRDLTWAEKAKSFPERSTAAVQRRYQKLKKGPRRPATIWTPAEEETLVEAVEARLTLAEAAELIGRSKSGIRTKILGLLDSGRISQGLAAEFKKKYTEAELELMREKRGEGMSWNDIRSQFFRDRTTRWLRIWYSRYMAKLRNEGQLDS